MAFFLPPPIRALDNSSFLNTIESIIGETPNDYDSKEKIRNFFEVTIPKFSDSQFQTHFRLSRSSFESLKNFLGPHMSTTTSYEKKIVNFFAISCNTRNPRIVEYEF